MGTNHLAMRPSVRLFVTLLATLSIIAAQMAVFHGPRASAEPTSDTYWTLGGKVDLPDYQGGAIEVWKAGTANQGNISTSNGPGTCDQITERVNDEFDLDIQAADVHFASPVNGDWDTTGEEDVGDGKIKQTVDGKYWVWEASDIEILAAFSKGGSSFHTFIYAPPASSDLVDNIDPEGLVSPGGAGLSHTAFCWLDAPEPTGKITLDKEDDSGNKLDGAVLELYEGDLTADGATDDVDPLGSCTTGTDSCVFDDLELGGYTAVEAEAPDGYRLSDQTPELLTLTEDNLDVTFTFENSPIPYRISVVEDDVNPIGEPHTFDVTLEYAPNDDETWVALADAEVDLAWQAYDDDPFVGTITGIDAGTVDGDGLGGTCTTDAEGTCEVTVDSSQVGKGELVATFSTPYQHATSTETVSNTLDAEGIVPEISDSATKEWQGLNVDIAPSGVNLVGSPHTFTVTVTDSNGGALSEADVTIEWDGPSGTSITSGGTTQVVGDDGDPVTVTCETDAEGECDLVVSSDDVAEGTATITEVTAQIEGADGILRNLTVSADGAITFGDGDTTQATKTWIDFRAEISDDAVNFVEWDHDFEITVWRVTPSGESLEVGAEVHAEWDTEGDNRIIEAQRTDDDGFEGSCTTDGNGTCTITVEALDDEPSSGTMTVTGVGNVGVDADGVVNESGTGGVTVALDLVSSVKEWLDYGVTITPDGVNPVGTDNPDDSKHTFTIQVERSESDLGDDLSSIAVSFVWDGEVGQIISIGGDAQDPAVAQGDCTLDADGTCEVVVDSDAAGSGSLIVTGLTDSAVTDADNPEGVALVLVPEAELEDYDCTTANDLCATKTWVEFGISVEPPFEVNHVDVEHTFTVELTGDLNGVTVDSFEWRFDGSLADGDGSLGDDAQFVSTSCDDPAENPCEIVVSADAPGDLRLTVTSATVTTMDGEFTIPFGDGADLDTDPADNQADKDFIDYRVTLEPPAYNLLGDDHTFEVVVERLTADGGDEAADNADLTLCWDGPAGSALPSPDDEGCESFTTDSDGEVTVTVSSPDAPGTGSLTVASIDSDGDVVLPEGGVSSFEFGNDYTSSDKTWVVYDLELSNDAINALGDDHTFTISNVTVDDGTGPVTATGATITAVWSEDEAGQTRTCTVGGDGSCTITVASPDAPGSGTLTLTKLAHTFAGESFEVDLTDTDTAALADGAAGQSATKTWRDFRVTIVPDDVNLTGDSHTFTVTIEQTDDGETWAPVPNGTTLTSSSVTGYSLDTVGFDPGDVEVAGSCLHTSTEAPANGGTVDGDCELIVSSDAPGMVTVTVHTVLVANDHSPEDVDGLGEVTFELAEDHQNDAFKAWVEVDASLTPPSAVNVAGDDHDFLVEVTVRDGGTNVTLEGMELCFEWTGDGTPTLTDDCVTLSEGDLDGLTGTYTYTVTAPTEADEATTGMGTLELTDVNFDVELDGVQRSFRLPEDAGDEGYGLGDNLSAGTATDLSFPLDATKLWVDYGIRVTPSEAVNPLPGGEEHTFTVELFSSDPGGFGDGGYEPGPAPIAGDGVTIDLSYAGVGDLIQIDGEDVTVDPDSFTCEPTATVSGEDVIGVCEVTVSSSDVGTGTLTASFTATSDEPVTDRDAGTLTVTDSGTKEWRQPAISIVKTVDPTEVDYNRATDGEVELTYTYVVTNTGDERLRDLTLVDDYDLERAGVPVQVDLTDELLAELPSDGDDPYLDPGTENAVTVTATFTLSADEVGTLLNGDSVLDNEATTTGVGDESDGQVSADDTAQVAFTEFWLPSIELTKTAVNADVPFFTEEGAPLTLLFVDGEEIAATVTYEFVVTNGGDEPLVTETLTLVDDKIGDLTDSLVAAVTTEHGDTLPVGGSVTVTADHEVGEADFVGEPPELVNVADVSGVGAFSGETVEDDDNETVDFSVAAAVSVGINIVKEAIDGFELDQDGNKVVTIEGEDGSATVSYQFVITNIAADDLTDLELVDDKIGDLTDEFRAAVAEAFGSEVLPAGASVTITADHEVTADDFDGINLTNVIDVLGVGVDSGATATDFDDETVTLVEVLPETLPETGIDAAGLTGLGLLLALIGAASLLFTRRRRDEQNRDAALS